MSVGPSKELQAGSSTSGLTSAGPPHEDRPDYTSSEDPISAYLSSPKEAEATTACTFPTHCFVVFHFVIERFPMVDHHQENICLDESVRLASFVAFPDFPDIQVIII